MFRPKTWYKHAYFFVRTRPGLFSFLHLCSGGSDRQARDRGRGDFQTAAATTGATTRRPPKKRKGRKGRGTSRQRSANATHLVSPVHASLRIGRLLRIDICPRLVPELVEKRVAGLALQNTWITPSQAVPDRHNEKFFYSRLLCISYHRFEHSTHSTVVVIAHFEGGTYAHAQNNAARRE